MAEFTAPLSEAGVDVVLAGFDLVTVKELMGH